MAREIKETPVLSGKNADRFEKATKNNESQRVSAASYNRAQDTYNRINRKP
ncbi:MAG: hypothetical protein BMS9Abin36_0801 [Gammaproteobacteria bacterium]|nr:MAG: hypothetical protein BMS9Abin36_0801 [Gammaproteobacteria bacterium]